MLSARKGRVNGTERQGRRLYGWTPADSSPNLRAPARGARPALHRRSARCLAIEQPANVSRRLNSRRGIRAMPRVALLP